MRNYFAFLLGLSLVCACGRDQLDASYLFDVYQSPAGQVVRKAEKECADLGLRFTSLNTIDASAEAQVALERPFLTYSGKMKALENYVRAVHEVEVVFATRTPAEMPARSRAALIKSGEIARTILALDKHGRGAIYSSDGELSLFTERSLSLAREEADLAKLGIHFRVSYTSEPILLEHRFPESAAKARAFAKNLGEFQNRFGHDLASPLIRLKKEAIDKAIGTVTPL